MEKLFSKLNLQKGVSMVELLAVVASASIVISGVSVKAGDIINEAKDTQRVANLRQIATAMELYYSDFGGYPQTTGGSAEIRFDELISQINNYLASFPTARENYDYQDFNRGQDYVLKVNLENPGNPYLEADIDEVPGGIDCQDPFYCIKM